MVARIVRYLSFKNWSAKDFLGVHVTGFLPGLALCEHLCSKGLGAATAHPLILTVPFILQDGNSVIARYNFRESAFLQCSWGCGVVPRHASHSESTLCTCETLIPCQVTGLAASSEARNCLQPSVSPPHHLWQPLLTLGAVTNTFQQWRHKRRCFQFVGLCMPDVLQQAPPDV